MKVMLRKRNNKRRLDLLHNLGEDPLKFDKILTCTVVQIANLGIIDEWPSDSLPWQELIGPQHR